MESVKNWKAKGRKTEKKTRTKYQGLWENYKRYDIDIMETPEDKKERKEKKKYLKQ